MAIYNDYIPAMQNVTLSEVHEFELLTGVNHFIVETWLSLFGELELQEETSDGGWKFRNMEDEGVLVERDYINGSCHIICEKASKTFNSGEGSRIRVICHDRDFSGDRLIGASNGLPHQKFSARHIGRFIKENTLLQVPEKDKQGDIVYYDWNFTNELDIADGNRRAFYIDNSKMEISFGDNENGLIPPTNNEEILFAACRTSLGDTGNINSYEINDIFDYSICTDGNIEELKVQNIKDCTGGRDDETIINAMARVINSLYIDGEKNGFCLKPISS